MRFEAFTTVSTDELVNAPQRQDRRRLHLRQLLWGDGDLADEGYFARTVENEREKLLLEYPRVVALGNRDNVKAALELGNAIAAAETDRETNLNTRGAAVAAVAGLTVTIATAVAKAVFGTASNWTGSTRKATEYLFLGTLVFVASAMVMAVMGVLRPGRGGRTKIAVGEAVVDVWCQPRGDVALAAAADRRVEVFWLDRLLRAIPQWHYRNRSKARWLRRAWIFLMLGILLIGLAGVIVLAELPLPAAGKQDQWDITWVEIGGVIAVALGVVWILLKFDLIGAGRRRWKRDAEEERKDARKEAEKIAHLLLAADWTFMRPAEQGEVDS